MEEINKCFLCDNTSYDKVLVRIEDKAEKKYVCIWCLPRVIHETINN